MQLVPWSLAKPLHHESRLPQLFHVGFVNLADNEAFGGDAPLHELLRNVQLVLMHAMCNDTILRHENLPIG